MEELREMIQMTRDARELKRALSVEQSLSKRPWDEIVQELRVSRSFISKWRAIFKQEGVSGLSVSYQGSKGYLSEDQRENVITWLQKQKSWNLEKLRAFVEENYGFLYKSKQSYYDLFAQAGSSWKKSQKRNPKKDSLKVEEKQAAIKKT